MTFKAAITTSTKSMTVQAKASIMSDDTIDKRFDDNGLSKIPNFDHN